MHNKTILLIDDSPNITALLKLMLLTKNGIEEIYSANNPDKAKEIISKEVPDLIILDITFSKGFGIKLLKWAKLYFPETVFIILTNHSDNYFRDISVKAGADYFLDKSTEFEKVET